MQFRDLPTGAKFRLLIGETPELDRLMGRAGQPREAYSPVFCKLSGGGPHNAAIVGVPWDQAGTIVDPAHEVLIVNTD